MRDDKKLSAMISSTAIDLPEHRKQVLDACLRVGVFPIGMEQLPARDADAIRVCEEMVDDADYYIGIYAYRYGWIPDGKDISITEIEFERAVERKKQGQLKEILIFLIHEDHPITIKMVETDADAQKKLAAFKQRATDGRIRAQFKSPEDLRGLIVHALGEALKADEESDGNPKPLNLHPPTNIPTAPAPYIAHPYVLLETKDVVGRSEELALLTDWVTKNEKVPRDTRIFSVVAIGGMGKSALTWKWFEQIAPNELPTLAGRLWWSFYESDATWENFTVRALAYVNGIAEDEAHKIPKREREDQLLRALDARPFLLVLDGLERILLAYARFDTARLPEDDLDDKTANPIDAQANLPDDIKETYLERHRLRQCIDTGAGRFLRMLAKVRASRVLISTRLYPAELQKQTAHPLPGCYPLFLQGLKDDEALALWREFIGGDKSGTSENLLPVFRAFGNYPLLLRALAGEVANYVPAPGNFDQWQRDNPEFSPAGLPLKQAKSHMLLHALRGLGAAQCKVLHTIAAFRTPAAWDTVQALLCGKGKACPSQQALIEVLSELEDRGLLGWDRAANRYDLHPIVRSVVWARLKDDEKRGIPEELHGYFDAAPHPPDALKIERIEELTPAIDLYHALVDLMRHNDAYRVFKDHLDEALLYRLSNSKLNRELLERLLPSTADQLPLLTDDYALEGLLIRLAHSHLLSGELTQAASYYFKVISLADEHGSILLQVNCQVCLTYFFQYSGRLRESVATGHKALDFARKLEDSSLEEVCMGSIGMSSYFCGTRRSSLVSLMRAVEICREKKHLQAEGLGLARLAQRALLLERYCEALDLAQRAWMLAKFQRIERDFIRAARLHGAAALGMGDHTTALERLQQGIARARLVNSVEEELPALVSLAELHRQRGEPGIARELLEEVWAPAERGPFVQWHADALNVLAQIERDAGNVAAAIAAATKAYELAWCDGPPWAYHYGLTKARQHLRELDAPEPALAPFDESKFEPMPEVEINPRDKYYVEVDEEGIDEDPWKDWDLPGRKRP